MGTPKIPVLTLTIKDINVLYPAYMNFLEKGGLFIPTARPFEFGQTVSLMLNLLDEPEKLPVLGKVVWITPAGAQGNRAPGIGVAFEGEDAKRVRDKIELHLAGMLDSSNPTYTL